MKRGFYPKLALSGISKNRKIYLPYILTCIGIIMMFYIISFLSTSERVAAMRGGGHMQTILGLGAYVMGFFALVFLFYTNSFLIRKRKKEFGLFNILGMGKRNIARILMWETLFIAAVSLASGLFCGILFSKAAELLMAHMLGGTSDFTFTVGIGSIIQALVLFSVIFLLILLNSLRQVHVAKPVELLRSDTVGEKPPKSNWAVAILGVVILAGAYYLALSVKEPLSALLWFFAAVIMVIIASYLLFIAGSVALCRLLQRNKRYYYKTNHFVSVSSMAYRMKRNGAGLASICILSTMVLVMISSTVCLYIGAEDGLRNRYPRDIIIDLQSIDPAASGAVDIAVDGALERHGARREDTMRYRYLSLSGYINEDRVFFDRSMLEGAGASGIANVRQLFVVPLEDYNRIMGASERLAEGEVMLYCTKSDYGYDYLNLQGLEPMKIIKILPEFVGAGAGAEQIVPSIVVVVPSADAMQMFYERLQGGDNGLSVHEYYGFNLAGGGDQAEVGRDIRSDVYQLMADDGDFPTVSVESIAQDRSDFYALYGGMFFLGVLLGMVFILGAVLIMYYKQISEGYEDQRRFDIMQKVGMTKREIKRSVDSQVLTVFFLPLVAAGIHVIFDFPMISKLLALFNLTNIRLFIIVTACCYLVFALFYVMVYIFTSRAYYSIVSGREEA